MNTPSYGLTYFSRPCEHEKGRLSCGDKPLTSITGGFGVSLLQASCEKRRDCSPVQDPRDWLCWKGMLPEALYTLWFVCLFVRTRQIPSWNDTVNE